MTTRPNPFSSTNPFTTTPTPNPLSSTNPSTTTSAPNPSSSTNSIPGSTANPTLGVNRSSFTVNLSGLQLSDSQLSLLDKGLTFIPTYKYFPLHAIYSLQDRLIRNLKLKDYFLEDGDDDYDYTARKFVKPSTWTPADHKIRQPTLDTVQSIVEATESVIASRKIQRQFIQLRRRRDNLTAEERRALRELQNNDDIVIKPADKGSCTVVMDKSAYVNEVRRQLDNTEYYRKLDGPIYQENVPQINDILDEMTTGDFITDKQLYFLRASHTDRRRIFYVLPKIHKPRLKWPQPNMPDGRPIVSDCGSESYRVSQFIDSFIRPISMLHPSYLKDTYDFVSKIRNQRIPKGSFLVTGDVTALYTNMRFDRTLETVRTALQKHPDPKRPDDLLLKLLDITMRNNDFEFDGETYLQICGMAMGKTYAPGLADIYMEEFDEKAHLYHILLHLYFRFLDDIFFIWTGSEDDLRLFESYLNSLIPGIKITLHWSTESVDFLDTTVYRHHTDDDSEDVLYTRVFFKETDTHQLLHKSSFHPRHTARGVLKSQLLRFKRLSSTKIDFDNTCGILFHALSKRNYSRSLMRKMKRDIWQLNSDSTIVSVSTSLLPIVVPYNDVGTELSRLWRDAITDHPVFSTSRLVTAYTAGSSLKRKLVRSTFRRQERNSRPAQRPARPPGSTLCPNTRCRACSYIMPSRSFSSSHNSKSFTVRGYITCKTTNVVYLVTCRKCQLQYVGETSRPLADRINDHLSAIRLKKQTPISLHFNSTGHSIADFRILGIDRIDDTSPPGTRRIMERTWQNLLQTNYPHGINNFKKGFL